MALPNKEVLVSAGLGRRFANLMIDYLVINVIIFFPIAVYAQARGSEADSGYFFSSNVVGYVLYYFLFELIVNGVREVRDPGCRARFGVIG